MQPIFQPNIFKGSIKLAVACDKEILLIDSVFHNDVMENVHHCSFT